VLRIGGESKGADEDVRMAQCLGLRIYRDIDEVPVVDGGQTFDEEPLSRTRASESITR